MSVATVRRVVCRLGPDRPTTDAELVAALTGADREPAFAELVERYGPMVLGVCRRVLSDAHDAEDAFQATFLVLARKSGTIRPPGAVGGWLYGVAVRTARKAKTAAARRRRREMATAEASRRSAPAGTSVEDADLRTVIDAELAALPESQRAAVVLCDLHGKTRAEAAAELNRPEGTVAAWLARGRKALAARLARRGVTLPAAGLGAVATPSAVSAKLASSAVATVLGRGIPAGVLALAEGVMRSLSSTSSKLAAVAVAFAALLGAVTTAAAWPIDEPKLDAPPIVAAAPPAPAAAPVPKPEPDVKAFLDHKGFVYSAAYAPDGKKFLSVGNGTVIVWDTATQKKLFTVEAEFAQFSDDGKSLFYLTKDEFHIADAATGKSQRKFPRGMPKTVVGGRWATVSGDGLARVEFDGISHYVTNYPVKGATPKLHDQQSGIAFSQTIPAHGRGGAFAPGGITRFAGIHRATTDHKEKACLTIWKLHEGNRAGTISRPNQGVQAFAWSPDGKEIVVAYPDSVRVYLTDPKIIAGVGAGEDDKGPFKRARKFDVSGATTIAWSKDGKQLAVATSVEAPDNPAGGKPVSRVSSVLLLDSFTGKELRRVEGFPDNLPIVSLAFHPEGKHLVTAAGFFPNDAPPANGPQPKKDAPGLRVIPLDAPKPEPVPAGPVAWKEVKSIALPGWLGGSVAYSPDGKTLFVGGTSGFVRSYDTATWKQLLDHQEPTNFAAVAVSPDGKSVAVTFKDADRRWGVRLLNATTGKLELTVDEGGVPGVVGGPEPIAIGFFPDVPLPNSEGLPPVRRKVIFGTAGEYVVKTWTDPAKASTITSRTVAAGKQPADAFAAPLAIDPNDKWAVVTGRDKDTGENVLWAWSGEANKVLDGHKATVVSAAWSKNGKVIVSGDAAGVVIVWDAATFKEKSRVKLGGRVAAVAVTHDGIGVAAGVVRSAAEQNTNGAVFVWLAGVPPEKPEPLSSHLTGTPFLGCAALAFSPDGKQLASCFANHTLLTRTGILVGRVTVFAVAPVPPPAEPEKPAPTAKGVTDVSFSPDGKQHLAVGGGKAEVFDTATGKQVYSIVGEAARLTADGKALVVMGEKQITYHDATSGRVTVSYDRPKTKGEWHRVAFTPDGKQFVADFGLHAGVYDVATGKELVKLDKRHEMLGYIPGLPGRQLVVSPNGKKVAVVNVLLAQGQMGAAVWDTTTGKRLDTFPSDPKDDLRTVTFSPDSASLAVGYVDRVEVWVIEGEAKKNPVRKFPTKEPVTALAYSKDGKQLALGLQARSYDRWWADVRNAVKGEVLLLNAETGEELRRLKGFQRDSVLVDGDKVKEPGPDTARGASGFWVDPLVTALAFAPDGKALVAGTGVPHGGRIPANISKGGEVKVFDLTAPEKPAPGRQWTDSAVLNDHKGLVNGVAVAPDGKSFAAATDRNVTCWDTATRKVLWTFKPTDSPTCALAYSPDGKHLCVATKIDVTRLDAKTGANDPWTDDNAIWFGKVGALAYHPDGVRLAASNGYQTRVRRLDRKDMEVTFGEQPENKADLPVLPASVAWSKDGKWLALVHREKDGDKFPVVLWEVEGKQNTTKKLSGHAHRVTAVAWSKDGNVIASGDEKGFVILWHAATGKELWRRQFRGRDDTDGHINALAFSPADNTLAVAVSMGSGKGPERVVLLEPKEGKDGEHLMRPWSHAVTSVAWSKDGAFLVTGCGSFLGKPVVQTELAVGEVVVWERKP
jgi:RNA polymerase sigma factor (sigma-70 family)